MNKIDFLEKNLAWQLGWIQAADNRLALILPLSTAMLGALAAIAPSANKWTVGAAIFASFAVVLLGLSVLFCAFSSFPRTDGPKGSVVFFGGIAAREIEQFRSAIKDLTDDGYLEDLARQCHINAQIADTKFTWVKRGLVCLFLATLPWALAIFFLYSAR